VASLSCAGLSVNLQTGAGPGDDRLEASSEGRRWSLNDGQFIGELREKTRELESLLDSYSERMRQRNRELEQEIASFETDLDRLREWLADRLDDATD